MDYSNCDAWHIVIFKCAKYYHNPQEYEIVEVILTGGPAAPRAPLGPVAPTGPCMAQINMIKNLDVNISINNHDSYMDQTL